MPEETIYQRLSPPNATYVFGLLGIAERFNTSLPKALTIAIEDIALHVLPKHIPKEILSTIQAMGFLADHPELLIAQLTEWIKDAIRENSGSCSLALQQVLAQIGGNPELIACLEAYKMIVTSGGYANGLMRSVEHGATPKQAVVMMVDNAINMRAEEHIDPTIQSANALFGSSWFRP